MKKQQQEKWKKIRARGMRRYILMNGVAGWGLPLAFLYATISTYADQGSVTFNDAFYRLLIIAVLLFSIGGIIVSIWMWNSSERAYRKASGE